MSADKSRPEQCGLDWYDVLEVEDLGGLPTEPRRLRLRAVGQ